AFAFAALTAIWITDCHSLKKDEATKPAQNLIRLADLLTSESTNVESRQEFSHAPYFTDGWQVNDGIARAIQRNVRFDIPVPVYGFDSYRIRFKARSSSGQPQNVKVMARKNQIAFLTLGAEWKEYEFDLPDDLVGKENTNVRFIFNGKGVAPYA